MTYSGHVTPDGPAAVHELARLTVSKLSVGPMDNNAYLLRDSATGGHCSSTLPPIPNGSWPWSDPRDCRSGHHPPPPGPLAGTGRRRRRHRMPHDGGAIDARRSRCPPPTRCPTATSSRSGNRRSRSSSCAGTPGAIALYYDDPFGHGHLFVGDCLFPGGVGRTWSAADFRVTPGGCHEPPLRPLLRRDVGLPRTRDDTTLGAERPNWPSGGARGW